MQSLDIALEGVKAVFIYMLTEGVPKSNGTWEKGIQVVITSGVRDKIGQGMLLSSDCVYKKLDIYLLVYPLGHLLFCISCIVLRQFFGRIGISILMSGAYLLHLMYHGGDVRHRTARRWIISSLFICVAV